MPSTCQITDVEGFLRGTSRLLNRAVCSSVLAYSQLMQRVLPEPLLFVAFVKLNSLFGFHCKHGSESYCFMWSSPSRSWAMVTSNRIAQALEGQQTEQTVKGGSNPVSCLCQILDESLDTAFLLFSCFLLLPQLIGQEALRATRHLGTHGWHLSTWELLAGNAGTVIPKSWEMPLLKKWNFYPLWRW